MADSEDGFLSRWSRRKSEEADQAAEARTPDQTAALSDGGPVEAIDPEREAEIVAKLPDIESLDESSDFTQFLQKGVPEAIRRKALRKLWRLNPVFANLDGLNDYDEDFTDAATVVKNLQTLYQVGKGMRTPEPPPEEEIAEESLAEEQLAESEGDGESAETEDARAQASDSAESDSETSPPYETEIAGVESAPAGNDRDRVLPARTVDADDAITDTERRPHAAVGTPSAAARRWGRFRS